MQSITRLIIRAKKIERSKGLFFVAIIQYDFEKDKYIISGNIYNAYQEGEKKIYSEHDTLQEAKAQCRKIVENNPGSEDIVFYIDYGDSLESG